MADANIIVKIIDQTRGGMSSVISQTERAGRAANTASGGFNTMSRAIGAVAAAISVRAFLDFGSSIQEINNRIALINPRLGDAATSFQNITDIANRTFQPLSSVADLYQKVARSADQYGMSARQVSTVTESLTNLLRLSGASSEAAASAIYQFGQALGVGVLRGEDFNAINEATAGEILPLLAEELGVSTGQVKALADEGRITGDVIINALGGGAQEVADRVSNMNTTIGQSLVYLQNKFIELGQNGTPVFDAIANGIVFVADNLDTAVVAVGAFFSAFAVAKLAAITTSFVTLGVQIATTLAAMAPAAIAGISAAFGTLTAAVGALNAMFYANPIVLAIAAIGAAIVGVIVYWDELKVAATSAMLGIEEGIYQLQYGFVALADFIVNTVGGAITGWAENTMAYAKAVGAAMLDPLNAFEAFNNSLEASREAIAQNDSQLVDFSGSLNRIEGNIQDVNRRQEEHRDATEAATRAAEENAEAVDNQDGFIQRMMQSIFGATDATEEGTGATDDNTDAIDDNADAIDDNADAQGGWEDVIGDTTDAIEEQRQALEDATDAINESIAAYDNETYAMGLAEDQREVLNRIIQEEQRYRRALGDEVEALSEAQIRTILEIGDAEQARHLDFLRISDEQVDAIINGTRVRREQQAERDRIEDEALERQRERARQESEFEADTQRLIQSYYEETTSEVQQLIDERQRYIERANELGLQDHRDTQDAILEYERAINQARIDEQEELLQQQQDALNDFRNEYDMIYDDIFGIIEDFTGLSSRELERYNQYAKLLFGVDLLGSVQQFADGALTSIAGLNTGGTAQINQLGTNMTNTFNGVGGLVGSLFGEGGTLGGLIGGFVNTISGLFSQGGGGLWDTITGFFSGIGDAIGGLFGGGTGGGLGGVFSDIVDGISGIFGGGTSTTTSPGYSTGYDDSNPAEVLSDFLDGVFGAPTAGGDSGYYFDTGGLGGLPARILLDEFGNLVDSFDFFANGGYIRPGQMGIVGEAGPEFVQGPATVSSTDATADMMSGVGVNVNFTINAIDAQGVDEMLIERKELIKDIFIDALNRSGRGIR